MNRPMQMATLALTAASVLFTSVYAIADDVAPRATGLIVSPQNEALRAFEVKRLRRGTLLGSAKDALPSKWDAREQGWITSVKNQENLGTCWSFAALATIETQLKKSGRGTYNLSEKNMVSHRAIDVPYDGGAYPYTAAGYLLRWSGPVLEAYDQYIGNTNDWPKHPSPTLTPAFRIQDVVWVPPLDGTDESRATYKAAIREHGAVCTVIGWYFDDKYEKGANYYYNGAGYQNHAITVVGWDDNYAASNFATTPPGNGAWIIKNSWGTYWGNNGFYYVSYYDTTFARSTNGSIYIPAEDGYAYDTAHGYDCAGPVDDVSSLDSDLQAVVFTAAPNERLAAVGVWTRLYPKPYEIAIYTNVTRGAASPVAGGVKALVQTGTLTHPGYTTIPLQSEIPLADGTGYAVVYRQTGDESLSTVVANDLAASNDPIYGRYKYTRGNCYIGKTMSNSTVNWQDLYDRNWALCLKAYTRYANAASVGELPGATEDGTAMLADLETRYPTLFYETFGFGSIAGLVGGNGHSFWSRWMTTGFDPSIPEDKEFTVSIYFSPSGLPRLSLDPDLGARRTYTVWGRDSLAPEDAWREVDRDNPSADGASFFCVTVSQ